MDVSDGMRLERVIYFPNGGAIEILIFRTVFRMSELKSFMGPPVTILKMGNGFLSGQTGQALRLALL